MLNNAKNVHEYMEGRVEKFLSSLRHHSARNTYKIFDIAFISSFMHHSGHYVNLVSLNTAEFYGKRKTVNKNTNMERDGSYVIYMLGESDAEHKFFQNFYAISKIYTTLQKNR